MTELEEFERYVAEIEESTGKPQAVDMERDLLQRPLAELLTHDHVVVAPGALVSETVNRLHQENQHFAVVVDNDHIVGIFTERDILHKLAGSFEKCAGKPIQQFMTANPATLEQDVPIAFALNLMVVGGYRHVPITNDGKLVGTVSVRDILAHLAKQLDVIAAGAA